MQRIWHPFTAWECYPAGLFSTALPAGMSPDEALDAYAAFLRDTPRFEAALARVIDEWPISCEHFLSNEEMNRIAFLGQASMCIETGIPARFRAGFKRLSETEQTTANATALKYLNRWLWARKESRAEVSVGGWFEGAM